MSKFKKGVILVLTTALLIFVVTAIVTVPITQHNLREQYVEIVSDGAHSPGWDTANLYFQSLLPMLCDQGFHPGNFGHEMFANFIDSEYIYNFVSRDGLDDNGGEYTIAMELYIDGLADYSMNQSHWDDDYWNNILDAATSK